MCFPHQQASSTINETYDKYKNLDFIQKANLLRKEPMQQHLNFEMQRLIVSLLDHRSNVEKMIFFFFDKKKILLIKARETQKRNNKTKTAPNLF